MYLFFGFTTALIESTSSTKLILLSQVQRLAYIIIVSDYSLTSWVYVLPLLLRENKTTSIHIYLPILYYINLFGISWRTQVMWNTLQHQTCERSTSFIQSLQRKHCVLLNRYISVLKSIYQLLNPSSTDTPPFLAWLTGHLRLCHLTTFASFCWIRCHHSKVGVASTLVSWFGYPLL